MTPPSKTRAPQREASESPLDKHIQDIVDMAPPLTAEQRDRLAVLLRTADVGGRNAA